MAEFELPENPEIEHSQALPAESDFELAYRCMLGELMPSFLHEFNNPLTVLSSSAGLLGDIRADDEAFAEITENIASGSADLIRLSDAFRHILKASIEKKVSAPVQCCEEMLLILGYRMKRALLPHRLSVAQDVKSLHLPERSFFLVFYSLLELSALANEALPLTAPDLQIRLAKSEAGKVRFALHLPLAVPQTRVEEFRAAQKQGGLPVPAFLLGNASPFFRFVLEQSVLILKQIDSFIGWRLDQTACLLEITIPAE